MKNKFLSILLGLVALLYAVPVLVTVVQSLRYEKSIFTLRQFGELFITNNAVLEHFWLSVGYSAMITFFSITLSFPLGFLFAKMKFWGRNALFFVYILVMMLPFQATLLPNYIQLSNFNLMNTPMAIIIPMIFSPFAVFLFRQCITALPDETIECTLIETSSLVKLFVYIIIPQIKPAIIAISVIVFCESWNIIEQALVFLSDNERIMPLSIMLNRLPENVAFSGAILYMMPALVIFTLTHESLQTAIEKFKW